MRRSKIREAETAYGTVKYETVTCASCGSEVAKDDALTFRIEERDGPHRKETVADGYACPHCADVGPIGYPSPHWTERVWNHPVFIAAFRDQRLGGYHIGKMFGWAAVVFLLFILSVGFLA
jgi:DNA-directed RNA polymerase subunit RPC12/RpoP